MRTYKVLKTQSCHKPWKIHLVGRSRA